MPSKKKIIQNNIKKRVKYLLKRVIIWSFSDLSFPLRLNIRNLMFTYDTYMSNMIEGYVRWLFK